MPPLVKVTLIPETDARARATPRWVAGAAFGSHDVAIFPARVGSYPYAALVSDVQRRHGAAVPGAIADRVANGASFPRAFRIETGDTPADAAVRAWMPYQRWTNWIPVVTSGFAVWMAILALACLAVIATLRKRVQRRRQWADEEP